MERGDFTNVSGLSGSIPKSENICKCREAIFLLLVIKATSIPKGGPVKVRALIHSNDVHKTRGQTPFIITAEAKKTGSNCERRHSRSQLLGTLVTAMRTRYRMPPGCPAARKEL